MTGYRRGTSQRQRRLRIILGIALLVLVGWEAATRLNWNPNRTVGDEIDRLNGVAVFYNGGVSHTSGRNQTADGYNLGLSYQCVEFVKRYYYQRFGHRMPDSYGHAKQFFEPGLPDGSLNPRRGLLQFMNSGSSKPRPEDLIVFGPSLLNRYGHVAIVSAVTDSDLEIVQQNPGPFGPSRERIALVCESGQWRCQNRRVLGWLRKPPAAPGHPIPAPTVPSPAAP